jgi:two-component system response regulator HydG
VDYIAKPIEAEVLYKKIDDALKYQENQKITGQFRDALIRPPGDVYTEILNRVNEVIHDDSHLLVIGDQGTGKTSVARYVYSRGRMDSGPFVTVDLNQQTINRNGERGDYEAWFMDLLEKAKGGLLLVKNLQKTGINFQTVLLKALSTQKKDDDFVQIILTTGEKKEQLSSVLLPKLADLLLKSHIELPTLKGNEEVILFFAEHFLDVANRELNKKITKIDREVLEAFFKYSWDENIKELKNLIFKACLLTEGNRVSGTILPLLFRTQTEERMESVQPRKQVIEGLKKENYEKEKILEALEIAKGNKTVAASILNIDRKTLYNKIKLYNVELN